MQKNGIFITLEGPDGSGKSTVAKYVNEYLKSIREKTEFTREPGGTSIGEEIREILLDNKNSELSPRTEALLYASARAQHVEEKIQPLLDDGYIVLSDRYVLSSLAYQGFSRGLGIDEVMKINEFAMGETYPDLVLFFDVDPEIALGRKYINREGDRMENEGAEFHKKTYAGYNSAIEMYPKNITLINANGSIEETVDLCIKAIDELMK